MVLLTAYLKDGGVPLEVSEIRDFRIVFYFLLAMSLSMFWMQDKIER